jgi:hypothetical protein
MARARDYEDGRSRADGGGHPLGLVTVATVQFSRYQEDGPVSRGQFGQPGPQGLLSTGTGQAQAGRETGRRVGQAFLKPGAPRWKGGEEWMGKPPGEEGSGALPFYPLGQGLVASPPFSPFSFVLDAGRGADEDEAIDQFGVRKGDMEGGPSSHRVTHPCGRRVDGLGQEVRGAPQIGLDEGRAAVARGVGQDEWEAALEPVHDRGPGAGCLGEAVQQDEGLLRRPGLLVDEAGRQCPVLSLWMALRFWLVLGHPVILNDWVGGCHPTVRREAPVAVRTVAVGTPARLGPVALDGPNTDVETYGGAGR